MKVLTPLKAMRAKCLDCCCDQAKEVELCTCKDNCPLWPYRMGKMPEEERTRSFAEAKGSKKWNIYRNGVFVRTMNGSTKNRAISTAKLVAGRHSEPTDGEWTATELGGQE